MSGLSYEDWTDKLARFFFDEAHAGNEILFAVDDVSLSEASGLSESESPGSLAAAVESVISKRWFVTSIVRRTKQWRPSDGTSAHPALPFLALTVLAASRMGEHEHVAAHNYYVPLRTLIDPSDTETGAPGSFTEWAEWLWLDLSRWANEELEGRRGRLVVRSPGFYRFVGLAIQHALVRSSDLRHLDAFFRRIGLEPGEMVPATELRRALGVWAASREEPWARRLARIASDPELREYCEALLDRQAKRWDGRPRDPRTGRPIGRFRIGIRSPRRPTIEFYAQWDERLPKTVAVDTGGAVSHITRWHGWYQPFPFPGIDASRAMEAGIELRGDLARFSLSSEDAYALAYDDDLGAWVSVDTMSYGDSYMILVRSELRESVRAFLDVNSSSSPERAQGIERFLPSGWTIITKVRIDARPRSSPPSCLASLIPVGGGPRLRLLGGLPITNERGVYLRGGEPAIALSTLVETDELTIRRLSNGEIEHFRSLSTESREIPLWKLELQPDHYEITHGESTVRLQIVDGIAESAGPGVGSVRQPGRDSSSVVGTSSSFPTHTRRPITIQAPPTDRSAYLIGVNPQEVATIDLPVWISAHVGFDPSWAHIDAWPSFDPVWQLTPVHDDRYEAVLLSNRLAPTVSRDGAAGSTWADLIRRAELAANQDEATALWESYRSRSAVGSNES